MILTFTVAPIAGGGYVNLYGKDITESKQKEEEIHRLNAELQARLDEMDSLLEILPTGVWIGNHDCSVITGNPAAYRILGFDQDINVSITNPESDVPTGLRLFVDGKEVSPEDAPMQVVARSGKPWHNFEHELLFANGMRKAVYGNVVPLFDQHGTVRKVIASYADFTERKQAEEALAESTRQQGALYKLSDQLHRTDSLGAVFDAALEAILDALQCNRASILLFDNQNVMRFVAWRGLSDAYRKAVEGHSPWKRNVKDPQPVVIDDVRTAELAESLRAVVREEGIGSLAFIPLVSNGRLIGKFMIYFNAPHVFGEGEIDLSLTIARQVISGINRMRADEALRESEERFRTMANTIPSIVWIAAPDGTITYANDQWFRYAGITPEANAAGWPELVLHPDDYERCVQAWTHALETVPDEYLIEVRNRRYDGQYRWFQTRAVPVRDEAGKAKAWYGVTTDIHERIEAQNRLALLAEISDMLRNVDDTYDLMYRISEAVGEHLHVKRALFNEIDLEHDREIVHRDYHNGIDSVAGVHKVSEYSSITSAKVAAGRTVVNTDSKTDPRTAQDYERTYARTGERAYVVVPLMRDNRWVASLWVSDDAPRQWTYEEVLLLETVAERTWAIVEKFRMAEALRAKEAELEAVINQTPFMLTRCTRDMRYRFVSRAYADMIGRPPEEIAGQPIVEIMGEEGFKTILPYVQEVLQGNQVEYESKISFEGSGSPYLHVIYTPDRDEAGNAIGWFASIVDISERKRAENALRVRARQQQAVAQLGELALRERDLQEVFNQATGTVAETLDVEYCNVLELMEGGESLLLRAGVGWQEGLVGTATVGTALDSQAGFTLHSATPIIVDDLREERRFNGPPFLISHGAISGMSCIIRGSGGLPWGVLGAHSTKHISFTQEDVNFLVAVANIMGDAIQREQVEEDLRASESLYRTIARSIPGGGVYVVDKDFRYLVAEGPVTEAFRLTREMLEGRTVMEVFPDERGQRTVERLQRTFAGERVEFETNFNGRVFWTQQAPLLDSIGHAIIVTMDITDRKQAEDALRQSEERFARFMQHLPGLAWIKDVEGRYVYANAATEKAFNAPREKLYGSTDEEIFPPETAAQFKQNDQRAYMEAEGVQVIETLPHQDGILHHSLVSKFPIPGPDGSTALIGGTAFDITERLGAEEALRESEERFRAILRQATAGIVRKDAAGRLVFVNEAFCNMLGYTEADLIGNTVWDFMHPDDIAENRRSYQRLMMEGIPFKLERRFLREDGSIIWVDASVSPIMDATGKPQSAVAVEVDVTARKQAEDALRVLNLQLEERVQSRTARLRTVNQTLREEIAERKKIEEALRRSEATARENEETLSTLIDLLPVGISFLDPDGQIIRMNSALENILKLSKKQIANKEYKSRTYIRANGTLMPPAEVATARALSGGRTVYGVETGIVLEDGEVIWTSVSAAPVAVADVRVVVVTVDITDRKRAERALRESRARLQILSQRLVEVQEEERRAIAHELHDRVGQTLAALNINLLIVNGQLMDKVDEAIHTRMQDSMKLVAETITLVRDVMSNLRPSVLDDYGLEAALQSHVEQYMSRYEIKVVFDKPKPSLPRLGPSIEMTLLRIAQEALINIAKHAEASEVRLSLRQEQDAIHMIIQDNGTGIQSWETANRPGSHGMIIMRERAEAIGGNLKIVSVSGKGTTVDVGIPVKGQEQPQDQEESQ
jgi:PAS domain S-box-containing protein